MESGAGGALAGFTGEDAAHGDVVLGAGGALAGSGEGDAAHGAVVPGAGGALAGSGGGDVAHGAVVLGAGGALAGSGGGHVAHALAGSGGGDVAHGAVVPGAGGALAGSGAVMLGAGGALAGSGAVALGVGGALACDPFRGGAGGAAATKRKRTERLLASLQTLLSGWAENDEEAEVDDGYEQLFLDLEKIVRSRPADPVRALQKLLSGYSEPTWTSQAPSVAARWKRRPRKAPEHAHEDWSGWDSGGSSWVAPASGAAPAADDGGWQTVSRRKPKGRKQGDSAPQRVVQLGQGSVAAKGSGKGRGAVKAGSAGIDGTMRAADWCPRAADWDAGAVVVHTIDEVWADPTLDYVVFPRTAGELERFRTLVQSSESAPDITFIVLKGDAELEAGRKEFSEVEWTEARVPGTWRHQLRVASVWLAQCSSEAPGLKTTGLQPKAPIVQSTSVLRVHSDWVYCEKGEKAWAEITKNPGSHFRAWAAASFGSIKDTWQWQLTRGPGGAEATIEGLIRMPSARVAAAMSASGSRHGGETWFVSNVSRAQELQGVPALSVHWQDWEPNEAWGTYLARCRRAAQAVDFGLARGAKQLGVRRVASEAELARPRTLRRLWRACGIPRAWSVEEVNEFLLECSFTEPCVEERLPWRGATAWSFRATMPADSDFLSVDLDGDVIEFSRLGRDSRHSRDKALPMEIKQVYNGRRKEQAKPASHKVVALAKEPPEVQDGMAVDGGGDRQRLDDGKSLPGQGSGDGLAKRPKTCKVPASSGPGIPGGMKLIDNDGHGDCLFLAVSEALVAQGRSRRSATDLRNLCVTHLRKHEATYSAFWRGDAPDAEQSNIKDKGFAEYLRLIGRDKAWGGSIELAALACTLNQPIFVVRPLEGEFDIRVFGPTSSKAVPLSLWFQNRHYQALVGDPEAVAARAVKAEVGDPADRGGGKRSSCGQASLLGGQTVVSKASTLGGRTGAATTNKALSTLGRRTAPRSEAGSATFADVSLVPDEVAEAPEAPGPSVWALCQPRYRDNPLTAGGRIPTFECPHCDYAYSHARRDVVSAARRQHLTRWHDGDGLPGPYRAVTGAFRRLSAAEVRDDAFDWKCPACRFGLPSLMRQTLTKHVFEREKVAHRHAQHSSFDDKQWQALASAQAQKRRRARQARFVQAANKKVAKRAHDTSSEYDGYQTLFWPVLTDDRARPKRVVWKPAWSCLRCHHLWTSREDASLKAHRCCKYPPKNGLHKVRSRRFSKAVRFLRKSIHGLPEALLASRLADAEAALERSHPSCRRLKQKP